MSFARLFVKKSVADVQKESGAITLKRTLGPLNLVSLGVGAVIGAGIFVLSGKAAAEHAGPAIMLSFILAGIACAFAALCYAELASVLPISGSAYTYAYVTLGEVFAWVMGWLLILEYGLASATVAVGWSGYVVSFLGNVGIVIPPEWANPYGMALAGGGVGIFNLPAFLGILGVTALLTVGVSESAKVNNVIVIVKLLVILAFIGFGAPHINMANWTPFIPENIGPGQYGFEGVVRAAGVIFFAYIGFEAVSTAAQEAKNPQKDMPIGIIGSLALCTVLYIAVSAVLTGIVHYTDLSVPDPIAVGVDAIGLPWLAIVVKVGAIMGLSSVMLVLVYGQTRIFYTMSRDGLLPQFFSSVHKKFKTPHLNTMFVGLVIAFVAGLTPIGILGELVSMGTLLAFAVVCFSVLYLRKVAPGLKRPFKTPFMPFTPILGIAFCLYLISGLPWETFVRLKIWFIAGVVIYAAYGYRKSKMGRHPGAAPKTVEAAVKTAKKPVAKKKPAAKKKAPAKKKK